MSNNIDEDDGEVYFEVDDRHLFYGEIKPYFYKAVSRYHEEKRKIAQADSTQKAQ